MSFSLKHRTIIWAATLSLAVAGTSPALASNEQSFDTASSIGTIMLVVAAVGMPLAKHDGAGARQAVLSIGTSTALSFALKGLVDERRPDGRGHDSFPSGHSAIAFAAAASIENRYGWGAGLPALALASFVGTARVQAGRHYWHDVVAGAMIGTVSGFVLTSRHDKGVHLTPWGDTHSAGVDISARF